MNIIYAIILLLNVVFGTNDDAPEVRIQNGIIKGKEMQSRKGRPYHAFMGLRYAKPPVGNLRFAAPVPVDDFSGVFDASAPHGVCPQNNYFEGSAGVEGNEDCLFLNVYTPQVSDDNKFLLPVIMYIHGGAFEFGTANSLALGPEIIMDKNVVLVTPNYRLGALGFLSTGDEAVPGNNGLKDQALALRWTKDNIKHFGGNPDRIVVYGHSSGGASSHLQMLSPLSKDLIKGVIAQSGVSLLPWALSLNNETIINSKKLAKNLNCPTSSSLEMVDCLRKLDARDIILQGHTFFEWGNVAPLVPFKPIVEGNIKGAFLPRHPSDIVRSGEAANVPFITGITTEDGGMQTALYHRIPNLVEQINKDFDIASPILLQYTNRNKNVSKIVRSYYFGDKDIDSNTREEFTKLGTDTFGLLGTHEAVLLHAKYVKQPVFYYLFGYRGSVSHGAYFGYPSTYDYGVCHADELLYIFNLGIFPNRTFSENDEKMADVLTTIWENFAATGNPTPHSDSLSINKWDHVKRNHEENFEYYYIKSPYIQEMRKGLYTERVHFWKNLGVYQKTANHVHTDL